MEHVYPQETIGHTLYEEFEDGELRRVYKRGHEGWIEIGEFTRGPLTQNMYGAPAHLHCIHVDNEHLERIQVEKFFEKGSPFLVDYMDELDEQGIPYGYLNCEMDSHVSYRPARRGNNAQEAHAQDLDFASRDCS